MATILVVDDSKSMLEMVSYALKSAGFNVVQACDGVDALENAQSTPADLVQTDVNTSKRAGTSLVLFLSGAQNAGKKAVGAILTGMVEDRAARLREMLEAGAATVAQDEKTSVV